MKKYLLFIIVIVGFIINIQRVDAQFVHSVGFDILVSSPNATGYKLDRGFGYGYGVFAEFGQSKVRVLAGLKKMDRNINVPIEDIAGFTNLDRLISFSQFEIPILALMDFKKENKISFGIHAGFVCDVLLGPNNTIKDEKDYTKYMVPASLSGLIGVELMYKAKEGNLVFFARPNYLMGLTAINKAFRFDDIVLDGSLTIDEISFSIGLKYVLKKK